MRQPRSSDGVGQTGDLVVDRIGGKSSGAPPSG
jgi:hypothetical protein